MNNLILPRIINRINSAENKKPFGNAVQTAFPKNSIFFFAKI
jgi:hypothetical protein